MGKKILALVVYLGLCQVGAADPLVDNLKFDCFPEKERNKEGCLSRGCIWNEGGGKVTGYYDF